MSIFKAYDIRGIYPTELNEDVGYRIGKAFVEFLKCKNVVIGYDMRASTEKLFEAISKGITEQGADVINIGLCTTPMCYFSNGKLKADSSIMITASHNTGEYNGLKLCTKNALPISGSTGIKEIEALVEKNNFTKAKKSGKIILNEKVKEDYLKHISSFAKLKKRYKVVIDCANAMGIEEMKALLPLVDVIPMYDTFDPSFPNHEANPLKFETLKDLQKAVKKNNADLGISFDGDADRVGFVDETGEVMPMDLVTGIIAQDILSKSKETILYDLRSSKVVKETVESLGGIAVECRVGHAFIKQDMRKHNAFFAGEMSGHYYFKDNYIAESSSLAAIYILNLMDKSGKKPSELIKPLKKYFQSGEINSKVKSTAEVLDSIEKKYTDGEIDKLDGVKISYNDWWFSLRASNTDPVIRLNVEADTKDLMETKRDELLALIRK